MSVAFDTLRFARALQGEAKLSPEQAEGVAEAFADATGERPATKADLNALEASLREEILAVKTDLDQQIVEARASAREDDAAIKADVLVLKWMSGFQLPIVTAILFLLVRR